MPDRHDALSRAVLEMADRLEVLRNENRELLSLLTDAVIACENQGWDTEPDWMIKARKKLEGTNGPA